MDDDVTTTQPSPAHNSDVRRTADDPRPSRPSSAEEVARELISFLSQLSPFRIRAYRDDH